MTADLRVIHQEPVAPPRPPRIIRVRKRNPLYRWFRLSFALSIVICLLLVDGAFVAGIISRGLGDSAKHLQVGLGELDSGAVAAAAKRFELADRNATRARSSRFHPAFWVWRALPGVGDDAAVAVAIAEGLQAASTAGLALTGEGEAINPETHVRAAQSFLRETEGVVVVSRVDAARSSLRSTIPDLLGMISR